LIEGTIEFETSKSIIGQRHPLLSKVSSLANDFYSIVTRYTEKKLVKVFNGDTKK
jgi:hypothetical protein